MQSHLGGKKGFPCLQKLSTIYSSLPPSSSWRFFSPIDFPLHWTHRVMLCLPRNPNNIALLVCTTPFNSASLKVISSRRKTFLRFHHKRRNIRETHSFILTFLVSFLHLWLEQEEEQQPPRFILLSGTVMMIIIAVEK